MKMNKDKLIRQLAKNSFLNGSESKAIVNMVVKIISESLKDGEDVNIAGLGKFYLYNHKSRPVRNPKTNEPMMLPEFKSVKFRANSGLNKEIKRLTRVDDE